MLNVNGIDICETFKDFKSKTDHTPEAFGPSGIVLTPTLAKFLLWNLKDLNTAESD